MRSLDEIARKVKALKDANRERDQRNRDVHDVRSGDIDTVIPGSMPDAWPRPVVANMIDTTARDTSEVMGQMPSINCTNSLQTSDRSKKFSSKRTKMANHYVIASRLPAGEQVKFCDHYLSFGMAVYSIEPDFDMKTPIMRVENPMGAYPEFDLFGRLKSYSRVWREEAISLVAKYPGLMRTLRKQNASGYGNDEGWAEREIEVCKYMDNDQIVMYLPSHSNRLVDQMENPMGKLTVSIAIRPSFDHEIRGAFDDAIWVYLAKSRMAMLGLEATEKAVRAPLAVPRDLQRMVFGGDAVLRTDSPEKIKYVGIDMPQFAAQEAQNMERELRLSTRTPESRTGAVNANIITGKGIEALQGGFDTVITTGQQVIGQALKRALEYAFEMDEKLWPDEKKTIRGMVQGAPFEETYVPSKDIGGNYLVDVAYGFAAGQDPARAIVAMLQLRGDNLVSRDFVMRQLPMDIDVVQMQTQIDNEQFEDALKSGLQGLMQSIPQMAQQGMDPMDTIVKVAEIIKLREQGKPIHDAIFQAYKPKEAPQGASAGPEQQGGPMGQGGPPGAPQGPPGAHGAAPGQGGPTGMDMMQLLSSMKSTGGAPVMTSRTRRQVPI
jgi:hypothetical protein